MNGLNVIRMIRPLMQYQTGKHLFKLSKLNSFKLCKFSNQSVYLVDETKECTEEVSNNVNKYTTRTASCGELTMKNVGQRVVLCGWLEFSRMDKFLVLRDAYGQTQLLIQDESSDIKRMVKDLNFESNLMVKGTVVARPKNMINPKQTTGEIEVVVENLKIANEAVGLPFNIREHQKANEALRMEYRYLAMRFSEMQQNLRFRSEMTMNFRQFLSQQCGFVDVETPTLFKATPGGAQEFVVPTRHENKYYSLVQSPQQFKQMLMCGGIDRYFQIARCYRDETSRPDRQPEFTQLDIEMSYTTAEGVMELIEDMFQYSIPNSFEPVARKFPRMRYNDAINLYGSDKPDTRFDHTIIDCTQILQSLNTQGLGSNFYAGCLVFQEPLHNVKFSSKSDFNNQSHYPQTRIMQIKASNTSEFSQKLAEHVSNENIFDDLTNVLNFTQKATIFIIYGDKKYALKRLGKLREECAASLYAQGHKMYKSGLHFLWLMDFPLFSLDETGQLQSEHHPFTTPNVDDLHLLESDPLQVRAQSYDLVLNGNEVGGGSIRIHDPKLQSNILQKLRIKDLDHIVEMLSFGCPPHGGIALGLDRLFACILNTESIRDVIAFPKTFDGKDPISGAPSDISEKSKKLYHL